jgi:hypothetical protein
MRNLILILILCIATSLITSQTGKVDKPNKKKVESRTNIICEIEKLESNRDPKCHATATRLENFIYGTTITSETRFLKVKLQKKLLFRIWERVSKAEEQVDKKIPRSKYFKEEIKKIFKYSTKENGDIMVWINEKNSIILKKRDVDHYSSIAYALRTILALQQEILFDYSLDLVSLDQDSITLLKEFLDIFTLSVLHEADGIARESNLYQISADIFKKAWQRILPRRSALIQANLPLWKTRDSVSFSAPRGASEKFSTINEIIQQKVKSYENYNRISIQVFMRNLQVYFARHQWPADSQKGHKFKELFTETMIAFTFDALKLAEKVAKERGDRFIREEDVNAMWGSFVPFEVNDYEDVIFFPKLGRTGSLTIESYDFDAFRDGGIHWRYLQYAIKDNLVKLILEPDPFAAELLVEGVAQFGVLLLRVAGMVAKDQGDPHLDVLHLKKAMVEIKRRTQRHGKAKSLIKKSGILSSSDNITRFSQGNTYFTDVTINSGIKFSHRTSDWLSRLLRSYIKKSPTVGTLNIPPAFGGSGVAAGDVNGDGIQDILILSGSGNALYLGDGNGKFRDFTGEAGIVNKREDGMFGEPRQPIIADFDNDGWKDILITYVKDDHKLYRNLGRGKFKDVSARANLKGKDLVGGPAIAFDYDRDGLLDIYIMYFGDYLHGKLPSLNRRNLNGLPNRLFKNMGNLTFKDVTQRAGVGNTGWGQAGAHTDFNLDGWQDIIVGNDFGVNVYYRNRGDGTFENVASQLGTDKPSFTMNVGLTDLNRDGFPDVYISNIVTMVKDEKYVLPGADTPMKLNPAKMANMRIIEANDLFVSQVKNDKLAGYSLSEAVGRGFSSTGWAWGALFFDFDNDGDDDLYCVNGMNEYKVYSDTPYYTNVFEEKREIQLPVYEKETNVFFVNEGGILKNDSQKSGTNFLGNSRSTLYLDFDNDGDLDIILNNYHGPAKVYRNNSEQLMNHWLKIILIGDPDNGCNRDAIGAKIIVYKNNNQIAWREIRGGEGYLSMGPTIQHVGIGKEKKVDVRVTWPNGSTGNFKNFNANQSYLINQKSGKVEVIQ